MASLIRLLSFLIASGVLAYSYSFEDHEIVADVAQELIEGTPAAIKVKELLGSSTMAEVSTCGRTSLNSPRYSADTFL